MPAVNYPPCALVVAPEPAVRHDGDSPIEPTALA